MRSALDATTAHFILRSSIFSFPVVNRIYFRYTRRQRWPESAHTNIHKNKKKNTTTTTRTFDFGHPRITTALKTEDGGGEGARPGVKLHRGNFRRVARREGRPSPLGRKNSSVQATTSISAVDVPCRLWRGFRVARVILNRRR